MRFRLEQNAVALLLVWSAVCFGIGVTLQHGAKAAAAMGGTR